MVLIKIYLNLIKLKEKIRRFNKLNKNHMSKILIRMKIIMLNNNIFHPIIKKNHNYNLSQ